MSLTKVPTIMLKDLDLSSIGPTLGGLFTLHTINLSEDTHELIALFSGPDVSGSEPYILINHTTGQFEMEVNNNNVYTIDRDTGMFSVDL